MSKRILTNYIHDLIREHKKRSPDGYELYVYQIPDYELKLFFKHIIGAWEYEALEEDFLTFEIELNNMKPSMQKLIDAELDEVHAEDCINAGMKFSRLSDSNEIVWRR